MIASELSVAPHAVVVSNLVSLLQTWDSNPGARLGVRHSPRRLCGLPHCLVHCSPKRTWGTLDLQVEHQGTLRRGRV